MERMSELEKLRAENKKLKALVLTLQKTASASIVVIAASLLRERASLPIRMTLERQDFPTIPFTASIDFCADCDGIHVALSAPDGTIPDGDVHPASSASVH
jgi:hypothetical protein